MTDSLQLAHDTADELFERYAGEFGDDLDRYRGHVQRVLGLVGLQGEIEPELARPLGVAAFYHDAGIWFDNTWDYLPPSIQRAVAGLAQPDKAHGALVEALIDEHHRLRKAGHVHPLVPRKPMPMVKF